MAWSIWDFAESEVEGQGAKMIRNGFESLWSGSGKVENGVGLIFASQLIGNVLEGQTYNDRVMNINIVLGDVVWEVLSCYCLQAG